MNISRWQAIAAGGQVHGRPGLVDDVAGEGALGGTLVVIGGAVLAASLEYFGDAVVTHRVGAWHCLRRHGILEHSGGSSIQAAGLGAAATTPLGCCALAGAIADAGLAAGLKRLTTSWVMRRRLRRTSEAARRHGLVEGGECRAEGAEGLCALVVATASGLGGGAPHVALPRAHLYLLHGYGGRLWVQGGGI